MTARALFEETFAAGPDCMSFAPGRVNLIGEHIDYNGGAVLPFALSRGVHVAVQLTDERTVSVVSDRFDGVERAELDKGIPETWARYAFSCAQLAADLGWIIGGARIAVVSDLSDGAGLSSSAALCVSILKALRDAAGRLVSDVEIAKLARRVENEFIGIPCGIMDQMAVALARPGSALFLETRTLDFDAIPLPRDHLFLAVHSGIQRQLADGRYKERKEECDIARQGLGTEDLCHIDPARLEKAGLAKNIHRRVRHCITEHQRVLLCAEALRNGNLHAVGDAMQASHQSMRVDFEVSVPGIDALVETAVQEGALGARLTGGGFGGCIVACVKKSEAKGWAERVLRQHPSAYLIEEPTP